MSDTNDYSDITPGIAIAAAELYRTKQIDELHVIARAVDADVFSASSIQFVLMVIDWMALNTISDQVAVAYENDDHEKLAQLESQGVRYDIADNGTLRSWIDPNSPYPFDFPIDFWTRMKFSIQAYAQTAAETVGIPVEVMNHLTSGLINDGIIKLLSGENEVAIPTATQFFPNDSAQAQYAIVAANAFVASSVIAEAANERNRLMISVSLDLESITYEDVANIMRESLVM